MAEQVELWDILDANGNKTGRLHKRGRNPIEGLKDGEYFRAVHVWIKNSKGEFLISKRSTDRELAPDLWECTGGAAIAGEDSLTAALREVKEELGLTLNPSKGEMIHSYFQDKMLKDIWLFREDFDIKNVVLCESETCDAKWVTMDEIKNMVDTGEFIPVEWIGYIYEITGGLA
jgi:isopentenyldiphosphate isomerase